MKKMILCSVILATVNSYAFDVNLEEKGMMTVNELVEIGAENVRCGKSSPQCILAGNKYGIQYQGQKVEDVELTEVFSGSSAIVALKKLKRAGFCK